MNNSSDATRLAQSASALGAAILGFGLGAVFGDRMGNFAWIIIVTGSIFHIAGMYVLQLRSKNNIGVAKALWISAWIC